MIANIIEVANRSLSLARNTLALALSGDAVFHRLFLVLYLLHSIFTALLELNFKILEILLR
jgi:23S rRNA maturation mini-RNase III